MTPANSRLHKRRTGFTLIELLVVVAIIAMLMSILLPSLRCAREKAKAAVCGTLLRGLGSGLATYFSENHDWIPGVNTTGVASRVLPGAGADLYRRADVPAQSFDWITPWLRFETDVGGNRAEKFRTILNQYSCPSQRGLSAVIYQSPGPDAVDFEDPPESWTALSYLMPAHFQYWGQKQSGQVLAPYRVSPRLKVTALSGDDSWSVVVDDYVSRLDRVGPHPDRKIAAADGTRYLPDSLILDFDARANPTQFGSFTSGGAWWSGSAAYGVRDGGTNWDGTPLGGDGWPLAQGANLELSYRHGCGQGAVTGNAQDNVGAINAVFFDGHVARFDDQPSRNIEYWYPSGSRVVTHDGMHDVPADDNYRVP